MKASIRVNKLIVLQAIIEKFQLRYQELAQLSPTDWRCTVKDAVSGTQLELEMYRELTWFDEGLRILLMDLKSESDYPDSGELAGSLCYTATRMGVDLVPDEFVAVLEAEIEVTE